MQSTNNNSASSGRSSTSSIPKQQSIDARTREIMNDAASIDPNPVSNDAANLDDIFDDDGNPESSMDDDDDEEDDNDVLDDKQEVPVSDGPTTKPNAEHSVDKILM